MGSKYGNPADEVLPGIWLGNQQASQDVVWLQKEGIQTVFNCTKTIPFAPLRLNFYRVPVDDNLAPEELRNLELWSEEIVYKLVRERNAGRKMLVHCHAGMQRSAACIAMLLIGLYRCTTDEAIAFIKTKRPVAFYGGANFYPSIRGFEMNLRKMIVDTNQVQKMPKIPLPT